MTLQPIRFTKDVVASYENTKAFLEGKNTLLKIAKKRELFRNEPLLFTRTERKNHWVWEWLQDATYYIRQILRIVLVALGLIPSLHPYLLKVDQKLKIGFRGFGTLEETHMLAIGPCHKKARPPKISFKLDPNSFMALLEKKVLKRTGITLSDLGITLLQPSSNTPQKRIIDLTKHPKIQITDSRLRKKLFDSAESFICKQNRGICRGMSDWFNYLYLQTQDLFQDPRNHMLILGKVFAKGGPREATMLQDLFIRKGKILNMTFGAYNGLLYPEPIQEIELKEYGEKRELSDKSLAIQQIDSLKPGLYAVRFPLHQCSYIKVSECLSYYFDPNFGILELKGKARYQAKDLIAFFNTGNYGKKGHPLEIRFYSMELRENAALRLNPKSLITS